MEQANHPYLPITDYMPDRKPYIFSGSIYGFHGRVEMYFMNADKRPV